MVFVRPPSCDSLPLLPLRETDEGENGSPAGPLPPSKRLGCHSSLFPPPFCRLFHCFSSSSRFAQAILCQGGLLLSLSFPFPAGLHLGRLGFWLSTSWCSNRRANAKPARHQTGMKKEVSKNNDHPSCQRGDRLGILI